MIVVLACMTNTPLAQRATPRPTRTRLPTFTGTPLPPTPGPTLASTGAPVEVAGVVNTPEPTPTETLVPPMETPIPPTETPAPPTNTPLPPPPPPPPPPPAPPTNTPAPLPTPAPMAISPLATPTNTAVPGSPSGRYKPHSIKGEPNCAHIGVAGIVRDGDEEDDDPIPNVTILVTGDEDGFRGPYYATTGSDGTYGLVIGEFGKVPERVEFKAEVYGPDVKTEDSPEWQTTDDCHGVDAVQIMRIEWAKD